MLRKRKSTRFLVCGWTSGSGSGMLRARLASWALRAWKLWGALWNLSFPVGRPADMDALVEGRVELPYDAEKKFDQWRFCPLKKNRVNS
eukprot:scaffold165723_cov27-Tisochrysis_lutea.AAC.1